MNGTPPRWNDGLEGAARRIAETDRSPLRVLAGPGTGKTFALMRRVMRLLETGVAPEQILVSTFTRTAARDLSRELQRMRVAGSDRVRAGTVHGLCHAVLSQGDVFRQTGRIPRPMLNFEEKFLLEDLRGTNGEQLRALDKRLEAFGAAWARLQSDTPGWPHDAQDQAFLDTLLPWLRFHESMLVAELVSEGLRFLRDNPASPHRPRLAHVLVDEYQDLNRAEQVLLDNLAVAGALTVIGDEDQSIYAFKFAHPEGIATFDRVHPGTHDESLDECRRCPRVVVTMANALIAHNPARAPRTLQPLPGNPDGEVLVLQWRTMEEEATGIAIFLEERIRSGRVDSGRVLVLAPRRQFGYAIRDALNEIGVRAHSFFYEEALDGNPREPDSCSALEAFALLTLLARPEDRVALRCWCGFRSPSLNSGAWRRIRAHCQASGVSPRTALAELSEGRLVLPNTRVLVDHYRNLVARLEGLRGLQGPALLDALFPAAETWAEPVRAVAGAFPNEGNPAGLLEVIQRGVTQPELPIDVNYVRVMSLHKSKGLTADLVIVSGCVEGLMPNRPRGGTPEDQRRELEEQRRVFYVAITRTRGTLVLSSVTTLPRDLAWRMGALVLRGGGPTHAATIASRFLDELGPARPATVLGTTTVRRTPAAPATPAGPPAADQRPTR